MQDKTVLLINEGAKMNLDSFRQQAADYHYMLFHVICVAAALGNLYCIFTYCNLVLANTVLGITLLWLIAWMTIYFIRNFKRIEAPEVLVKTRGAYLYAAIIVNVIVCLFNHPEVF